MQPTVGRPVNMPDRTLDRRRGRTVPVSTRPAGRERSVRAEAAPAARDKRLAWPVVLFVVALLVPWSVLIGPLRLSAYRVVLLATVLPCLMMWFKGRAGPIRAPDILILAFCLWCFLSLATAHGAASGLQSGGIMFIETAGAYLLARCYIRDAQDFKNVIRLVAWVVLFLLPFSLYETLTGKKLILDTLSAVAPTFQYTVAEMRMGLRRVQGPFEHPILYGVFCGSIFAMTFMVLGEGKNVVSRWLLTALVGFTALLSLSSAPIAAITLQLSMMLWNGVLQKFKYRWKLLWGLVIAAFLVVEIGSNQTPVQFYISHFTFDQQTGWYRLWIWQYGSASVMNHPLLGIGFGEWARPAWMVTDSIDNFWLVLAMRHGIPALLLMLGTYLCITFGIVFNRKLDPKLENYRTAFLICMTTYFFVGTTVHFWTAAYVWFVFLMGAGVWMLETGPDRPASTTEEDPTDRRREALSRRAAMQAPSRMKVGEDIR